MYKYTCRMCVCGNFASRSSVKVFSYSVSVEQIRRPVFYFKTPQPSRPLFCLQWIRLHLLDLAAKTAGAPRLVRPRRLDVNEGSLFCVSWRHFPKTRLKTASVRFTAALAASREARPTAEREKVLGRPPPSGGGGG